MILHTLLEVVSPYEEVWQSMDLCSGDVIRYTVTKEKIEVPGVLDQLTDEGLKEQ